MLRLKKIKERDKADWKSGIGSAVWEVDGHENIHVYEWIGQWTAYDTLQDKILLRKWEKKKLREELEKLL